MRGREPPAGRQPWGTPDRTSTPGRTSWPGRSAPPADARATLRGPATPAQPFVDGGSGPSLALVPPWCLPLSKRRFADGRVVVAAVFGATCSSRHPPSAGQSSSSITAVDCASSRRLPSVFSAGLQNRAVVIAARTGSPIATRIGLPYRCCSGSCEQFGEVAYPCGQSGHRWAAGDQFGQVPALRRRPVDRPGHEPSGEPPRRRRRGGRVRAACLR